MGCPVDRQCTKVRSAQEKNVYRWPSAPTLWSSSTSNTDDGRDRRATGVQQRSYRQTIECPFRATDYGGCAARARCSGGARMNGQLRLSDVDRWDPESLRQVARASRLRAEAAESAAQGLANPSVFGPADGPPAASAQAIAETRDRLTDLAAEAHEVGAAANIAAGGVEGLKDRLAALRQRASSHQLHIDEDSDSVVPDPGSAVDRREAAPTVAALQAELDAIVAQANRIDQTLAAAIEAADHSRTPMARPAAEAG